MTDKVQKIREEVEKLHGNPYYMMAVKDVLAIIDSLQEEPKDKCKGCNNVKGCITCVDGSEWAHYEEFVSKDYRERYKNIAQSDAFKSAYKNKSLGEAVSVEGKKPVSKDFEEALAMEWQGYNDRGAATVDALEDNTQELAFAKGFYRGAEWKKAKLPKWKNKPLGGGCWSGEISVDPIRRLYRYEHYIINADKLFKLLDKEE